VITCWVWPALAGPLRAEVRDPDPKRWEPQIRAFEQADQRKPPPEGAILFVGSSSIRGWDLERSFPGLPTLNRGFVGSHISDVTFFADRILFPYRPKTIVLYAGDNDIAAGKPPERVFQDFVVLADRVHDRLPGARILFISIKPSLRRWQWYSTMSRTNELLRKWSAKRDWVYYVDIATPMLGDDGKPRPELFRPDGLHLNARGYALWTQRVAPLLRPSRDQ